MITLFQLLNSNRRGQILGNVEERHQDVRKIEEQMSELAELHQKVNQIVRRQEPVVINIEQKGEESHDDVVQANTEISGAIEKARSRNRKKCWCLLVVFLIIIVIAVVVAVVIIPAINKKKP